MTNLNHHPVTIEGPAGALEGVLWAPASSETGSAPPESLPLAAVVCHPHPLFGGTMHNKVVYQAAKALHRLHVAVLRFNFRGVGLSAGVHDAGLGETQDVRAALDYLAAQFPGVPLLAAGFSFGAWVGLRAGCMDSRVGELIALGLPVNNAELDFRFLHECAKPKLFVQGEEDPYGSKNRLEALAATLGPDSAAQAQLVFVPGADHFFTAHLDKMIRALSEWLTVRHPELHRPA